MKDVKKLIRRKLSFLESQSNRKYDFDFDSNNIFCNLFVLSYEEFWRKYGRLLRLSCLQVRFRIRLGWIESRLSKVKKQRDSHDPWDRLWWREEGHEEFVSLTKRLKRAESNFEKFKELAAAESTKVGLRLI